MKLIAALASAFILTACAANNNAPRRAVFSPIMPESERKQLPSDRYTAGEMYSQAYDALVIREGPGVSMGSRYAANYKGTQIVCGAGNYGAGRDKFSFIYFNGIVALSSDRGFDEFDREACHSRS